jgi:hypothetical protein
MDDDQKQRPDSLLPYERWIEQALRRVVAQAVEHVAQHGLPGGHHFYITFRTDHPGAEVPQRVRAQYPREMTIVLQHQFWDLAFDHEAQAITVGLSFGGVPARLAIPLESIVEFADPHIRYGLRFQAHEPAAPEPAARPAPEAKADPEKADPEKAGKESTQPGSTEPGPAEPGQVVSLDAFRRRSPQ